MFYGQWPHTHTHILPTSAESQLGQVIQMRPLIKNHCSVALLLEQWPPTNQCRGGCRTTILGRRGCSPHYTCVMVTYFWTFLRGLSLCVEMIVEKLGYTFNWQNRISKIQFVNFNFHRFKHLLCARHCTFMYYLILSYFSPIK